MRTLFSFTRAAVFYGLLAAGFPMFIGSFPEAQASEPDDFTRRPTTPLEWQDTSALSALNQKTNQMLDEVLPELQNCDLRSLHYAVKNALGGSEIGKLENWATTHDLFNRRVTPLEESIYAHTSLLGTRSVGIALMGIVPSVVINGHYVGVDKLGHFFDQGYDYYERIFVQGGDALTALKTLGRIDEEGNNGMGTNSIGGNGIRSYGDMAANFQGYLFWRDVAAGPRAFYRCDGLKFVRTQRAFDWAEYVSDAWDEAINCCEFTPAVKKVVDPEFAKRGMSCPVTPASCQKVLDQPCGFTYLSPACMPYVHIAQIPDAACARIIREDSVHASTYKPGYNRDDFPKFLIDMGGAGGILIEDDWQSFREQWQIFKQELWRAKVGPQAISP